MAEWKSRAYAPEGLPCAIASYVDNLIAPSMCPLAAPWILEDCEQQLLCTWDLQIGGDSREAVLCKGCPTDISELSDAWSVKEHLPLLGSFLERDGSTEMCVQSTFAAMNRSLYANLNVGLRKATDMGKIRFMNACVLSIARSRWCRWPWTATLAARLNKLQRRYIAILLNIRPLNGESAESFLDRRKSVCTAAAAMHGLWSNLWAVSIQKWGQHVGRDTRANSWTNNFRTWRDKTWRELRRQLLSTKTVSHALRARRVRGRPHKRWYDGYDEACRIANLYLKRLKAGRFETLI